LNYETAPWFVQAKFPAMPVRKSGLRIQAGLPTPSVSTKSEPECGSDRPKIQPTNRTQQSLMRPTNLKNAAAVLDWVASLAGRYRDPVLILSTHLEFIGHPL